MKTIVLHIIDPSANAHRNLGVSCFDTASETSNFQILSVLSRSTRAVGNLQYFYEGFRRKHTMRLKVASSSGEKCALCFVSTDPVYFFLEYTPRRSTFSIQNVSFLNLSLPTANPHTNSLGVAQTTLNIYMMHG